MNNLRKTLFGKIHGLNLQTPVKIALITGVFILLGAILQKLPSCNLSTGNPLHRSSKQRTDSGLNPVSRQLVQKVSPYEFARAVIESLGWAADARQVLVSTEATGEGAVDTLRSMTNMRIAINKLDRAIGIIQRFSNSDDGKILLAVEGFNVAYTQLILALEEGIRTEEKLVGISNERELGALLREESEWIATADEAWKMLPLAAAATAHVLVDNDREEDGRLPYLRITSAEKSDLIMELEENFGESVKKGLTVGQHAMEAAPAAFWQFLNQSWKPSDA